jgi:hypothetical protein
VKREIGWSMAEIMAMPWDEFIAELREALALRGER